MQTLERDIRRTHAMIKSLDGDHFLPFDQDEDSEWSIRLALTKVNRTVIELSQDGLELTARYLNGRVVEYNLKKDERYDSLDPRTDAGEVAVTDAEGDATVNTRLDSEMQDAGSADTTDLEMLE